jgi:hypothetical protein
VPPAGPCKNYRRLCGLDSRNTLLGHQRRAYSDGPPESFKKLNKDKMRKGKELTMYGWARLSNAATSSWVPWKVGERLNKGRATRKAARINAEPSKVR